MAVTILGELREQVTERVCSLIMRPSPLELCGRLELLWSTRQDMVKKDMQEVLEGITDDLDEHRGILDYCISAIEDAFLAEQASLDEEESRQTWFRQH